MTLRDGLRQLAARLPPKALQEATLAPLLAEAATGPERATVLRLTHPELSGQAGAGALFDFSRATLADRWQAGERAMRQALRQLAALPAERGPGLLLQDVVPAAELAETPA